MKVRSQVLNIYSIAENEKKSGIVRVAVWAEQRLSIVIMFDHLRNVMVRDGAFGNGSSVFNLDETNDMAVQKCAKVLATKG